jgi:hypothetical protein
LVILAEVTDEPTPEDLEQLAGWIAMPGNLGDRDPRRVIDALRRLAAIDVDHRDTQQLARWDNANAVGSASCTRHFQPNWPSDPGYGDDRQVV